MEEINDSIVIKSAETDEELCGRGYVHCTAWQDQGSTVKLEEDYLR